MFKSKEVMVWKYSLASAFSDEEGGCVGKLAKLYRTDRSVTARCMTCDYHARSSEFKVDRSSIVQPRIPLVKWVWKISPSV
jgi:hypothetical protein